MNDDMDRIKRGLMQRHHDVLQHALESIDAIAELSRAYETYMRRQERSLYGGGYRPAPTQPNGQPLRSPDGHDFTPGGMPYRRN